MKRNSQDAFLRRELERSPLPEETVNARLHKLYAELPDSLPVRRLMPVWMKRGLCTTAGLLAACGLMLGVNSANPALAESVPLVGSIFRAVNDLGRRPAENGDSAMSRIGGLAADMSGEEENTVAIPSESASHMTAALKEVYYDGSFVFAGLELRLDTDGERLAERQGPGYDILINGESQVRHGADGFLASPRDNGNGFCDMNDYFLTKLGSGRYAMQRAFRVPDRLQGADSLEIVLCFDGFDIPVNNSGFQLHFTAQKTEVPSRSVDCSGMEQNGVRLISAVASPTVTCLIAEYPESYVNPACGATFEDGIQIGNGGGTTIRQEDGTVRCIRVYAGLGETEERSLVWRLFDKNGSQQTEAVFVLDFQNGFARTGDESDLKEPPIGDYACGAEAVKNLKEGYIVEKYHASQEKPTITIASGSGKREDLNVEVWQNGRMIDSVSTHDINGWSGNRYYWEYDRYGQPDRENEDMSTPHSGWILPLRNGYVGLDLSQPLTVRAYNDGGELVLEEEIVLEIRS